LGPVVVPFDGNLVTSLGGDHTDGRNVVVIDRVLVTPGSDRLAKDVGRSEVETVGLTLEKSRGGWS